MRRLPWILASLIACATIGEESAFPEVVQTSGVGPFRLLDGEENDDRGSPAGRILQSNDAVSRAMVAGDFLFYAQADPLDEPPERDPALPEGAVDWAQFEPRAIYRGTRDEPDDNTFEGSFGFNAAGVVLEASEAWEGTSVFDPWALEGDGVQLYYAADGGIGLAEGPTLDGAFAKQAGPIVPDARAPSAVRFRGEILLFFEATDTGGIGLARSTDGRTFAVETRDLDVALAGETDLGAPGAAVATTPTGREVLRLYFEATDADGLPQIVLAATEDASTWERLEMGVMGAAEDARDPAPVLLPDGVTVLVITRQKDRRGNQVRAIAAGIAPSSALLVDPPPEDEAG